MLMNGKKAFGEFVKGKAIRRKDWNGKFISNMDNDVYNKIGYSYFLMLNISDIRKNIMEARKSYQIMTVKDLLEDKDEQWEEYVPLFDICDKSFIPSILEEIEKLKQDDIELKVKKLFLTEFITNIIYNKMKREPDKEVLGFIEKFALSKFRSGYCYYFARMLEYAFYPGGICTCVAHMDTSYG